MSGGLSQIDGCLFDVLIVGAGINGCAAARELAAQGYDVLLVDRNDFGGQATSRSGRILHCGLQLLAPPKSVLGFLRDPRELLMRLKMARRTALDHAELTEGLGAQLRPMPIAVPIYQGEGYSGWHVDFGARLIGGLSGGRSCFHYKRTRRGEAAPHALAERFAHRDRIQSIVSFVDQRFEWPERIAIDAALDAEAMGASIWNYTRVESLVRQPDGHWWALLSKNGATQQTATVRARIILNLAGVWVDEIIKCAGMAKGVQKKITPVKGVYALVRLQPEYRGHGVGGRNSVGEPITCLPWGDLHYIGPTETPYIGRPEKVRPEDEDLAFLMREVNRLLPGICLSVDDIVMAWAGLRAISAAPGHPKGKRLPFNVIHDLGDEGLGGMVALSWGTVVNHRSTARRLAALVARKLTASHSSQPKVWRPRHFSATISPVLQAGYPTKLADLSFCVEHEHARDLIGVLFARTGLAWTGALTRQALVQAAEIVGDKLAWSEKETTRQVELFIEHMRINHRYEVRHDLD